MSCVTAASLSLTREVSLHLCPEHRQLCEVGACILNGSVVTVTGPAYQVVRGSLLRSYEALAGCTHVPQLTYQYLQTAVPTGQAPQLGAGPGQL